MVLSISTEEVGLPERIDFWQQVVLDQFKIDCSIELESASLFRQNMTVRHIGPLAIMELEATPFRATRQSRTEDCLVTVAIPLEGSGTLRLNSTEVSLEVGTFVAYHSCKLTNLVYLSACRHLIVTVPSIFLADRCPEWECDTLLTLSAKEGMGAMFVELVHSLALHEECLSDSCRQQAANLGMTLLVSAVRAREENSDNTATRMQMFHKERIRNFALSRLRDPDLSIPQIAAAVGLSLRYIHSLFADDPLHLMQWIYEQRLARCHRELADPDKISHSITEIAYSWGFNSPAHFCRVFQKRFSATPSQIRGQAKSASVDTSSQIVLHP